ncbi:MULTISPECIES: head maturation protease, ClpP-related [unclassified Mycobacterium]|uniref:head maturation protease, ClpP-related n=1 Tax=unclassified Mycobacterium TaxID=2642494 RepID=UPI0029C6E848|nr:MULTISPECIES: head maturation protease, ClpP-related [unclassified Mycobacterium]
MPDTKREWFKFAAAKADGDKGPKRTTLHIYDTIGADPFFGGVDVNELVTTIEELDDDAELDVRINSPGGAAWDGLALANAIMRHPGKTTTNVVGLAASAASVVAMAGDNVVISKYGQMMLHNARFSAMWVTVEELAEAAKVGAKLNASIAAFYADRAGGTTDEWARAMKRETWYSADEAKDAGLATEIDESGKREDIEAAALASITKAAATFKYPGRQAAPAPTAQVEDGPEGPKPEEAPVATSKAILDALGLPEDASDDDVIAKIAEQAGDKPDEKTDDTPDDKVDAGEITELAAAAAKHGLTVIDPGTLAEMQRNSSLGAKAHAEMETTRITGAVNAAISLGKIPAARKEHFVALMRADEVGTTKLLADIPAETAVPLTELGHSLEPQAYAGGQGGDVTEAPAYKAWSVE